MSRGKVNFKPVTVAAAANSTWGSGGSTEAQKNDNLPNMNIHNISNRSAGACVLTITFDKGDGFIGTQTQAANTSVSYYEPGCISIKVANAVADTSVTIKSQEGY